MKSVYEKNYDLMVKLAIIRDGDVSNYRKSLSQGYMDLVVKRNSLLDGMKNQNCIGFSMAHYYTQNGDLCSDPVMEILFYPDLDMVEAFSFEMSIPPIYTVVYLDEKVNIKAKKELNDFLNQWLRNLVEQGHGVNWVSQPE
ncbi:TPA: hypothetical protein QDZ84_003470 [Shewanella algae]|uniref:DUF6908 domain-containing protein n=1 Tax=Shewanella algae TaxID=38313 RepID=UPI001C57C68F|nr:hypothetical protein [Shewanella algae]HDS1208431.1 hypothetical protein [Shewanella algae]